MSQRQHPDSLPVYNLEQTIVMAIGALREAQKKIKAGEDAGHDVGYAQAMVSRLHLVVAKQAKAE